MRLSGIHFVVGLSVGLFVSFIANSYIIAKKQVQAESVFIGQRVSSQVELNELVQPIHFRDAHSHNDNDKVAKELATRIRILCCVMTSSRNLEKKAKLVKQTWARRCNTVVFISSTTNTSFPTVDIGVPESKDHLDGKTMRTFRYIYNNHFRDADWFMIADDVTYVIMENLRYFLSSQKRDDPVYFGHHIKPTVSSCAVYILSKETMRRFGARVDDSCRQNGSLPDSKIDLCLEILGVKLGSTTDKFGKSRFHCFDPVTHLNGLYPNWYIAYNAKEAQKGQGSISDYAISFHDIKPGSMYGLEFYIYHLRPYGIESGNQDLNHNSN